MIKIYISEKHFLLLMLEMLNYINIETRAEFINKDCEEYVNDVNLVVMGY